MKQELSKITICIIVMLTLLTITTLYTSEKPLKMNSISHLKTTGMDELSNVISQKIANEYQVNVSSQEPDSDKEKKVIELATRITQKIYDSTNTDYASLSKYYPRKPYLKLNEAITDSEKFASWSENTTTIDIQWNYFRYYQTSYQKIKDVIIEEATDDIYLVKVYLDDVTMKNESQEMVADFIVDYEIIFEQESQQFKCQKMYSLAVTDLEKYYEKVDNAERKKEKTKTNFTEVSFKALNSLGYDYQKLENISEEIKKEIYNKNKESSVILSAVSNHGYETGYGSGFFIRKGIVMTAWTTIKEMIQNNSVRYYVIDNNENIYYLDSIVAIYPSLDIAIVKLTEEVGTPVEFNFDENKTNNEPIFTMSSSLGIQFILKSGIIQEKINDENVNLLKISLPLKKGDAGSMLINEKGQVIAINKGKNNGELVSDSTYAVHLSIIKDVIKKLKDTPFNEIKTVSFSQPTTLKMEKNNEVESKIWKKYMESPLSTLEELATFNSAYQYEKYITIRYTNSYEGIISTEEVIEHYENQLLLEGYQKENDFLVKDDIKVNVYSRYQYIILIIEGVG